MSGKRTGKPDKSTPRRDPFDEWAEANVEKNDPNQRIYPRSPPMAQLKPEGSPVLPEGALVTFGRPGPDGVALKDIRSPLFEIGDLVQLRSGGPPMTVFERQSPNLSQAEYLYQTSWFVDNKLNRECFGEKELVLKHSALMAAQVKMLKALKRAQQEKKNAGRKNRHRRSR